MPVWTSQAKVHRRDGCPLNWPARPGLSQASALGSWVADLDGRVAGHVSLSRADEGDLAPVLWSERNGTSEEQAAVVGRLFVIPRARGHGIGALLIGRAAVAVQSGGADRGGYRASASRTCSGVGAVPPRCAGIHQVSSGPLGRTG
ncbi:GNAT family N-acetyltransferase [Streptomyces sviceus]|uniref:GNAT family N-acetyltransferase n=1 Tax=Streptomyces sviceus TaxID=285530 RepID=UPI003684CEC0